MDIFKLKQEYNQNLTRYYNGCKYLNSHKEDMDKWLPELLKIQDKRNELLRQIMQYENVDEDDILCGMDSRFICKYCMGCRSARVGRIYTKNKV